MWDRHEPPCPDKGRSAVRRTGAVVSAYRDIGVSAVRPCHQRARPPAQRGAGRSQPSSPAPGSRHLTRQARREGHRQQGHQRGQDHAMNRPVPGFGDVQPAREPNLRATWPGDRRAQPNGGRAGLTLIRAQPWHRPRANKFQASVAGDLMGRSTTGHAAHRALLLARVSCRRSPGSGRGQSGRLACWR